MKSLKDVMIDFYEKIDIRNPEKLRNKTILVTGSSGLIGSNIIAFLDCLNQQKSLDLKIIGVYRSDICSWMAKSPNIEYIKLDLAEKNLPENVKFDYLIHAATYGQPKKFISLPQETVRLNINALTNLLEYGKKNRATLLYLSSSEIYGDADKKNIPTPESFYGYVNTLSDRAIYAEAKRLAETICYFYGKTMPVKIARVLIGYGPGVKFDDQRVIPEFIKKSLLEKKIVMMDKGKAQRTFCFIADTVEMLLNIMLNGKELVYNVCGNKTITVARLAKMIALINKAKVSLPVRKQTITGTPNRSVLDNRRYVKEFGKKRFVGLKEGLTSTSLWFKNLKST